jgi:hypothetical protein
MPLVEGEHRQIEDLSAPPLQIELLSFAVLLFSLVRRGKWRRGYTTSEAFADRPYRALTFLSIILHDNQRSQNNCGRRENAIPTVHVYESKT